MTWKPKYHPLLQAELERLSKGNALQKTRFQNASSAVARVLADPLDTKYLKSNLAQYRAVDVQQQYRLFFEIIGANQIVHFVWLNDEEYLHISGKFEDPAYGRFKTLIQTQKIEPYRHIDTSGEFKILGHFRKSKSVNATYYTSNNKAHAAIYIIENSENGKYEIKTFSARIECTEDEYTLLTKVCHLAKAENVQLEFFLDTTIHPSRIAFLRDLLEKCNFRKTIIVDEFETWEFS